jgi:hypothetical protein
MYLYFNRGKRYGKSKQFYHDVLGLDIVADFGANVTLTGGMPCRLLILGKTLFIRGMKKLLSATMRASCIV